MKFLCHAEHLHIVEIIINNIILWTATLKWLQTYPKNSILQSVNAIRISKVFASSRD